MPVDDTTGGTVLDVGMLIARIHESFHQMKCCDRTIPWPGAVPRYLRKAARKPVRPPRRKGWTEQARKLARRGRLLGLLLCR